MDPAWRARADGLRDVAVTRWRNLDPLLPKRPEFSVETTTITVSDRHGKLTGLADVRETSRDVGSLDATWGPLEQLKVRALVAPADAPTALDAILRELKLTAGRDERHFSTDSCVTLTWPSRDDACAPVLAAHGFHPYTVLAVRPKGRSTQCESLTECDVSIRRAEQRDGQRVADMWTELMTYDASFGSVVLRPRTAALLREEIARVLETGSAWIWLAERGGEAVGFVKASSRHASGWVESYVDAHRPVYLGSMGVVSKERGGGIGTTLARAAHAHLDREDIGATLLHYAVANPLAAPFWSRMGYRPLWTTWRAQPISNLT
ncbi:GNAT family N-acetyltransferase [Micromonospora sp. GCM10011542]|uniref:GNAT family N-acetyltransferase n=1 Tax=Micromonospora sp. GCM10011542 TaxID=3317337 RepID=UPI003613EDBA